MINLNSMTELYLVIGLIHKVMVALLVWVWVGVACFMFWVYTNGHTLCELATEQPHCQAVRNYGVTKLTCIHKKCGHFLPQ